MSVPDTTPQRFFGLDVHKHYLIAIGVDADAHPIYGPRRVELTRLGDWIHKDLTAQDAVALEMTTNTWQLYDELLVQVRSVTVVHPPHIALITRAMVMTDKIAASILARLLAKGLLTPIWVPPSDVRELRALLAQRTKMTRLSTQAKNRLHATLQSHHRLPPSGDPFRSDQRDWWLALPLAPAELSIVRSDLDTLQFARLQIQQIETTLASLAAPDERITWLVQLPGINLISALAILAAVGPIERFPSAKKLVGYAGLGSRVHDSGMTTRTGKITKAGRKDLRAAMVEAAQTAVLVHPHWKAELARLEPRLGRNKAIVAIARKLLVTVWYVLSQHVADRFADPLRVARKFMQFAYRLGQSNRPADLSAAAYVRQQLDRLRIGQGLTAVPWGPKKKPIPLPPSGLPPLRSTG
jgi:transposase